MSVLASPGTPTSRAWPPASTAMRILHHVFLADDPLRHLGAEALHGADEALELLDVVLGNALGRCHALSV